MEWRRNQGADEERQAIVDFMLRYARGQRRRAKTIGVPGQYLLAANECVEKAETAEHLVRRIEAGEHWK